MLLGVERGRQVASHAGSSAPPPERHHYVPVLVTSERIISAVCRDVARSAFMPSIALVLTAGQWAMPRFDMNGGTEDSGVAREVPFSCVVDLSLSALAGT